MDTTQTTATSDVPKIDRREIMRAARNPRGRGRFSGKYVTEVRWFVGARSFPTRKAAQAHLDAAAGC